MRRRAAQVVAIAAILGLGAGLYAGLGSTSVWRRESLDASFERLARHDVRVSVVGGLTVEPEALLAAIEAAEVPGLDALEARLVTRVPVTASHDGEDIPAAGEIVGVDLDDHTIDRWEPVEGSDLDADDGSSGVVLLDLHFARHHGLPPTGSLRVGATDVDYVGLALSPEYLNLTTTAGEAIQGAATRAIVYTSSQEAQRIAGLPGQANDAVVRLRAGVDAAAAAAALEQALATQLPGVPVLVTSRDDETLVRSLYDEIDSEQRIFDLFALLIVIGAGFAAFNLTKRVVDAQRHDIGIQLALGLAPSRIAIRTVLLAAQIAVLGVGIGIAAGAAIGSWVLAIVRAGAPLPVWRTPFQGDLFARAALLSVVVPFVAAFLPVWRAVRTQPVDALVPPHLRAGRSRLTGLLRRVRLPGSMLLQTPARRILRAPRRSALTVLAIAFVMAPLLAALGAGDSTTATVAAGERALAGEGDARVLVELTSFQAEDTDLLASIAASPLVERVAVGINTGGWLVHGDDEVGVSVSMVDLRDPLGAPASVVRRALQPGGIVISEKAAEDLGLQAGDQVTVRLPRRIGTGFRFVETPLPVRAVHDSPYRFVAYMDLADRGLLGLDGLVNALKVQPAPNVAADDLRRDLASRPGVASALAATSLSRTMRDLLGVIEDLFVVLQIGIAALAFLIAFNASNIAADERRREHATMFAFGVSVGRVVMIGMGESVLLGVAGVGLGLGLGAGMLRWILETVFPAAVPDLAVLQEIGPASYVVTITIAAVATAAAPLLNRRKLRRMDLPGTLRYVE